MMTSIIHGWQQAFSKKYRRSSNILTETTNKALLLRNQEYMAPLRANYKNCT